MISQSQLNKYRLVCALAIGFLLVGVGSYQLGVLATPSTSQVATGGQYQQEKPYRLVFTDGTYISCQDQDTGAILYGGPTSRGTVTGTDATAVINNCISGGGVITFEAGSYTVTTIKAVSFTVLNLGQAVLKGGGTWPVGSSFGAILTNAHFSVTTYAQDKNITVNGGFFMPSSNTIIGMRFSGVSYLTVNSPYCNLKNFGYACYIQDGAMKYVWLNEFQVQGPSANIAYFNYGIEVGGSPDLSNYVNNEFTWINYPNIQGISGDCGDTNANDHVWWIGAVCSSIGNTNNANKNDIHFDNEWNAATSTATTDVHYWGGSILKTAGISNFQIWVGAGASSVMSQIEIAGMTFANGGVNQEILAAGTLTGLSIHNNYFFDATTQIMLAWTSAGAAGGTQIGTQIENNLFAGTGSAINEPCGSSCTVNVQVIGNTIESISGSNYFIDNNAGSTTAGTWQVTGNYWDGSGSGFINGASNFATLVLTDNAGYLTAANPPAVRLTSPQTATSASYKSTTLTSALAANTNYVFDVYIYALPDASSTVNFEVHALASGAALSFVSGDARTQGPASGTNTVWDSSIVTAVTTPILQAGVGVNAPVIVELHGSVTVGATATTLQIDFNNVAAAGTMTLEPGSFMEVYPVA